jgi:Nif-specific regulatory protein
MSPSKDIQVKVLVDIGEALSSSLDIEKGLSSILKIISDNLNMQRGTITLIDPNTNELHIEVAHGLSHEEKERGRYKIGEGVTGKVVESGQPMVIKDIGADPLFLNKTQARKGLEQRKFAFLCVPIKVGNKVVGVLSVDHLFKGDISYEGDIKLLTIIASMVGQAVKIRELADKDKQTILFENMKLKQALKGRHRFENIVYNSKPMDDIMEAALQVADSRVTVLLMGESGTGKELVASAIHYSGMRSNKPFVRVACAALPENLLESELFGYERGAFTGAIERRIGRFEMANGGTIFLDEIGDLPLSTQVKLLRVIQERDFERLGGNQTIKVDVRIICATHRNLEEMIKEKKFREDLFYRINVFPLIMPPLRERKEDIPLLIDYFIQKYNKENKKRIKGMSRQALDALMRLPWAGNVRELENVIERAVVVCQKDIISINELPKLNQNEENSIDFNPGATLPEIIESIEKQKIEEALKKYKTQRKTAKALGITERILGYKIQKYKITN